MHICKNNSLDKISILIELGVTTKTCVFESYLLNENLTLTKPLKFELPYQTKINEFNYPYANFELLKNGIIIGKSLNNTILINTENTKKYVFESKIEGKLINSIRYYEDNTGLHFIGTYITKYTKEVFEKKPGLVKINFDEKTFNISNYKFIPFSDDQVQKIFPQVSEKTAYLEYAYSDKVHKNFLNLELDEIKSRGNDLILILSKSDYLIRDNAKEKGSPTTVEKFEMVPVKLSENNEITTFELYNRKSFYKLADPQGLTTLIDGDYMYSILGDTPSYGKDDPAGNDFNSRIYYAVTNLKTGITERKFFQLYTYKNKKDPRKHFVYYPLTLVSKYDNTLYFLTFGDIDSKGTSEQSIKFIGQLSITK